MRTLRLTTVPAVPAPGAVPAPVFYTLSGGLSRLVDSLARALDTRGVDVRVQTSVDGMVRADRWTLHTTRGTVEADAVIIATPAPAAAALLAPVDPTVATLVGAIDYSDVTLVTLRMPAGGVGRPLEGTGFLVPATAGCLITACTWLSSKWPDLHRPGDILLRASMGRFGDDRPAGMSDDELVGHVLDDLAPMLDLRAAPEEVVVTRWPGAFPQYALGHTARVASIEEAVARLPGVALAGAAYGGVGIPACIASGRQAARAVLDQHTARTATS